MGRRDYILNFFSSQLWRIDLIDAQSFFCVILLENLTGTNYLIKNIFPIFSLQQVMEV